MTPTGATRPATNAIADFNAELANFAGTAGDVHDREWGRCRGDGGTTASGQPRVQPRLRPRQPALDRPDRQPELARRLLARPPLQVAEHDRGAEPLRQTLDFLVDRRTIVFIRRSLVGSWSGRPLGPPALVRPPPGRGGSGARGDAGGDPEEPAPDRAPIPDRCGPAGEDQERRLERIFGVVRVAEDRAADAQDHRAVPVHQDGERGLVPPGQEAIQQLPVGQPRARPRDEEGLDLSQDGPTSLTRHGSPLRQVPMLSPVVSRGGSAVPFIYPGRVTSPRFFPFSARGRRFLDAFPGPGG